MYKKILLVIIALSISALGLNAQKGNAGKNKEVEKIILQVFDALSNRDSIALAANCTADSKFYENGKVWTLDTLINYGVRMNTAPDFKRVNTIAFMETEVRSDLAWTTYSSQAEITSNGKQRIVRWLETVVLVKENGKWKLKLLHSTLFKTS